MPKNLLFFKCYWVSFCCTIPIPEACSLFISESSTIRNLENPGSLKISISGMLLALRYLIIPTHTWCRELGTNVLPSFLSPVKVNKSNAATPNLDIFEVRYNYPIMFAWCITHLFHILAQYLLSCCVLCGVAFCTASEISLLETGLPKFLTMLSFMDGRGYRYYIAVHAAQKPC